jgi:hypothetical protein
VVVVPSANGSPAAKKSDILCGLIAGLISGAVLFSVDHAVDVFPRAAE